MCSSSTRDYSRNYRQRKTGWILMSYRVIAISGWSDEPSTTKLASPAKIYPPRPSLASRPLSSKCYSQFLPILSSSFVLLIEKLVKFRYSTEGEDIYLSSRVKKSLSVYLLQFLLQKWKIHFRRALKNSFVKRNWKN